MFNFKSAVAAFALLIGTISSSIVAAAESKELEGTGMTQQRMEEIVTELVGETIGDPGAIQFIYNDVPMSLISDVAHNRMRIVAVVTEAADLSEEHLYAMMISNFHLALDGRYALGSGYLYSTYIHPLQELTENQIESALRQVASLVNTFGESFTSGELEFATQSRGQEI